MTDTSDNHNALPKGYQLNEYYIESLLGAGGFGITYLAINKLNQKIAIKEYFPNDIAIRTQGYNVRAKSKQNKADFDWGLKRFLQEGQTLAKFQHPNIVKVLGYFEAHKTAYIVMEYEEGESLKEALKRAGSVDEAEIKGILPPLLSGLQAIHEAGFLHRDIKPDNIFLRDRDHSPVLLDFGAARYAMGGHSRSMTSIVTPGYAPFEQYETGSKQGAWSDIYAMGAVLYRVISGKTPVEATKRVNAKLRNKPDPLVPAVEIGRKHYSSRLLQCIDWALEVMDEDRPQSVKRWAQELFPEFTKTENESAPTVKIVPPPKSGLNKWALIGMMLTIGIIGGIAGYVFAGSQTSSDTRISALRHQLEQSQAALVLAQQQLQQSTTERVQCELQGTKLQRQLRICQVEQGNQQGKISSLEGNLSSCQGDLKNCQGKLRNSQGNRQGITRISPVEEIPVPSKFFRDRLRDGTLGPKMVRIPAGSFRMGDIQGGGDSNEKPVHRVSVDRFAMGRYEVTFAEYDKFAEATGRSKPGDRGWGRGNRPVINVYWNDSTAYAKWLSQQTGKNYRLPTEAEWEYAARAGTETKYWWGNEVGSNNANCDSECGDNFEYTSPVGSFAANPWGLHDTAGNVWEWVQDWSDSDYYSVAPPRNPTGPSSGGGLFRVLRGGGWNYGARSQRSANRYRSSPGARNGPAALASAC